MNEQLFTAEDYELFEGWWRPRTERQYNLVDMWQENTEVRAVPNVLGNMEVWMADSRQLYVAYGGPFESQDELLAHSRVWYSAELWPTLEELSAWFEELALAEV